MADAYEPDYENEAGGGDDPDMSSDPQDYNAPDQDLPTLMAGLDKMLKKYEATYYGDGMSLCPCQGYLSITHIRNVLCRTRRDSTT